MNTKKILTTAVLALMMTACSEECKEAVMQSNGGNEITITATIEAGSDSTLTRAVAESGTTITSSLTVDEQIAVLFSDGTNNLNRTATVKSVADGTATIEFTIPSTLANNTACTLVYPATAAKADNTDVKTYAELFATQTGVLSDDLDVRRGTATIQNNGTTASLSGATTLAAQNAIVKFSLSDGANALAATQFLIKDGSDNVLTTVTPTATDGASDLYVAMAPADASAFKFEATVNSISYSYEKSTATLVAGKYYQSPLTMTTDEPILTDLTSALEEGAIVAITYTIESVEYTSTFKKEGDEYIEQSTTAAAGAMTRADSPDRNPVPCVYTAPDVTTGAHLLRIQVNQNNQTRIDVTINVATCEQATNYASDDGTALKVVSVNGVKAGTKENKVGVVYILLKAAAGEGSDVILGVVNYSEGSNWNNLYRSANINGSRYLEIDQTNNRVNFSVNNYSGYLIYGEEADVVQPKDKVGMKSNAAHQNYYLKQFDAVTYKELSWDAANRQVVTTDKAASSFNHVISSPTGVTWNDGTYVINKNVTISGSIACSGNVNLIICDGCTLNVGGAIKGNISSNNKTVFTIYGQADATGQLVLNSSTQGFRGFSDLVIHSGDIKATTVKSNERLGITMYGGKFTASVSGSTPAIQTGKGNITVYGGEMEVVGGKGDGIMVGDDNTPASLTVYGGKVTSSAPNGKALVGTYARGDGAEVVLFESTDGSNWTDIYGSPTITTDAPYIKILVPTGN